MASVPASLPVPVDEYLNSSYHPDLEYVDGYLMERGLPTYFHSILQLIVAAYFRQFEKQGKYKTLLELRTQIIKRERYRIPDILLCATPTSIQSIMNETPLAVIEVLSPTDTVAETLRRFRDFTALGVRYLIQMDPVTHVAHRYEDGSLIQTVFQDLRLPHATIPFDSEHLFSELRREIAEAAAEDPQN